MTQGIPSVQFAFAASEDGQLVHIDQASKHKKYNCPGCQESMIPVRGDLKANHFRHHCSICSYESYLHRCAKKAIFQRLVTEPVVPLILLRPVECRSTKFELLAGLHSRCHSMLPAKYNLNSLFDKVLLENQDSETGLTPDVFLINTESGAKCYVEIHVTHPCTEDKISAGIPILEFHVQSETDISRLLKGSLNANDAWLTHYHFSPLGRIVDRCVDNCSNAKVPMVTWSMSETGRLHKNTCSYGSIEAGQTDSLHTWPDELSSNLQAVRLRNLIIKDGSAEMYPNCLVCGFSAEWADGHLYCQKKTKHVTYTEAQQCAQYRYTT